MKYLITLEVESAWKLEQLIKGQHGALIFGANHPWRVLEAKEAESECVCTDEPPYKECSEHSGY